MADPPTTAQSVGTFFAGYAAATTVSVLPILVVNPKRYDRPKWELLLRKALADSRRNIRLALLPVVLPLVYRTAHQFLTRRKEELESSDPSPGNRNLRLLRKVYNVLPALLSSPLFILLPAGIRLQAALYFLSTFLYTFARLKARPQVKFDETAKDGGDECVEKKRKNGRDGWGNWREYLPPVWTVSMLANTCLLWTFIFEPHAFPENYHDTFVEHCRRYLPISRTLSDVRRILNNTDHAKSIWSSPHDYIVCEVLHPTDVSCRHNFFAAFRDEAEKFAPWVAGATAVNMLVTGRFKSGGRGFTAIMFDFMNSTFRGTTYLSGSITSVWAISCVLQRILPVGRFSKSRWIINSSLASMWILLLSRSRQVAISLFQFRLAAYSLWKIYKSRGGRGIKHGDLWLIAACWVGLIHYKDRTVGKRITGLVGLFMRLVDGSEWEEWQSEKRKSEKGKAKEDTTCPPSGSGKPPRPQSPKPYYPPKAKQGLGYGSSAPGPSYSGPSYPAPGGPSNTNTGSYFPPMPQPRSITPPPPPPASSSSSFQQPLQSPPAPQPYQPPHPNSVPLPNEPSNWDLYSKPFGGTGTPSPHVAEPDRIEPAASMGVSAANGRFESTTTPPPRDVQAPLAVSRSVGGFESLRSSSTSFFAPAAEVVKADPPSRATTAGDPFSDSKGVAAAVEDPHELSEVGSGSAADISGSTVSNGEASHVLVNVEGPEEHHRDDEDDVGSDERMLRIDPSQELAESPASGISLLPKVEGEGVVMTDSMGSSGLVHVEKPAAE